MKDKYQVMADSRNFTTSRLDTCETPHCGHWVPPGVKRCTECRDEIMALEDMAAAGPRVRRMEKIFWGAVCVAAIWLFIWWTQDFWIDLFAMWIWRAQ